MTAANYYHVKVGWILHGRPASGAESYVNVPRETMHVRTATVFHVEHPIFMSMLHRSIDPHETIRGRFSGPHDFTGTIRDPARASRLQVCPGGVDHRSVAHRAHRALDLSACPRGNRIVCPRRYGGGGVRRRSGLFRAVARARLPSSPGPG